MEPFGETTCQKPVQFRPPPLWITFGGEEVNDETVEERCDSRAGVIRVERSCAFTPSPTQLCWRRGTESVNKLRVGFPAHRQQPLCQGSVRDGSKPYTTISDGHRPWRNLTR